MRSLARIFILGPIVVAALGVCLLTLALSGITTLLGLAASFVDEELS